MTTPTSSTCSETTKRIRSSDEPVRCRKCSRPSLRTNYGFCGFHRPADHVRKSSCHKPRQGPCNIDRTYTRTNASTLTSPGGSSYVKEGFSLKRTVDEMLGCKQTEFSPEKRRLVRHINAHTDQKYTAVPANGDKKRDRHRWLWRHCMQKCDGDENLAASLIHGTATSLQNVRKSMQSFLLLFAALCSYAGQLLLERAAI